MQKKWLVIIGGGGDFKKSSVFLLWKQNCVLTLNSLNWFDLKYLYYY